MKSVAIVYHSGFGHTHVLAKHIAIGANRIAQTKATVYKVDEVTDDPTVLNQADAIIFGSPTYMGSVSAPFKAFMDATSSLWLQRAWANKIAAGFTNSHSLSGDKLNTLVQLAIFAAQHGMIWVGQSEMNTSPDNEAGQPTAINRLGSHFGLMAQSENDAPSITPPIGDKETAERFGARIAQVTQALTLDAAKLGSKQSVEASEPV